MNVWKDMVLPLPVSLVTTTDRQGRANASPKSWWTPTSYDPPMLMLALKPESDTLANIRETGVWVWHLPPPSIAEMVLHTAKPLPRGECELDDVGFDWMWFRHDKLPCLVPLIPDLPYCICWAANMMQGGDHVLVEGQVGVAGGFDAADGVDDIVLHRGRNRFVQLGAEFEVKPY